MKRILTLLSLFFIAAITSQAQWTTGTNINNTNTGNVGVGVTNPLAKLEVVSNGAWSLHVGITGNRSNTFTQLQSSVASIAENSSDVAFNGAVAWDFFNNGRAHLGPARIWRM